MMISEWRKGHLCIGREVSTCTSVVLLSDNIRITVFPVLLFCSSRRRDVWCSRSRVLSLPVWLRSEDFGLHWRPTRNCLAVPVRSGCRSLSSAGTPWQYCSPPAPTVHLVFPSWALCPFVHFSFKYTPMSEEPYVQDRKNRMYLNCMYNLHVGES